MGIRLVSDYILLTGDTAFLDETVDGKSVLQLLKLRAANMNQRHARPDGLLDFGGGTGKWLEIRTSGYEHVVAAANGMAANLYQQIARWCSDRNDPEAARFQAWAETIFARLDTTLWNQEAGWYENHYPDGSRHLVINYHQFDLLNLPAIPLAKKRRMVGRIRDGEFLGPYGMFSMARSDRAHWDREDCDFGGGGQYVGYPLRIAESLYRMNEPGKAWDVLSRCIRWVERFPYFPQSPYADNLILQPHQQEWPLNISGGGGVQAVVFGLFGLHPAIDGSLEIAPCYNPSLGEAKLTGCRFRDHVYDVVMNATMFEVYCDGKKVAGNAHGKPSVIGIPAIKEKK